MKELSNKVNYKKLGLFKILEKISINNYKFEIPKGMR